MLKAVGVGALIALLLLAVVVALVVTGTVELGTPAQAPEEVLVIATAPDADGAEVAPFAFVLERGSTAGVLVDPASPVTVTGTSATSARDAYPFVGPDGVAEALSGQTGAVVLPWVALPPQSWAALVEAAGGIELEVPEGLSAYQDGRLVVLTPGRQRLGGDEAVALASALPFIEDETEQQRVAKQLSAGLSAVTVLGIERLESLVAEGPGESSLSRAEIAAFAAGR
jgi:hypothetical protein